MYGTKVHYLVTDRTPARQGPVHLLVPNRANSASNWLDVLAELRAHAHAIAVDLPGTIAGHSWICQVDNRHYVNLSSERPLPSQSEIAAGFTRALSVQRKS